MLSSVKVCQLFHRRRFIKVSCRQKSSLEYCHQLLIILWDAVRKAQCHGAIVECSSDSRINYAQSFHQCEWLSVGLAHLVHHRGTTPIILAAAFFSMLTLLHACCVFVMLLFVLQSSCCHTCVVMRHINVLVKPIVSSLRAILSIAFTFKVPHLDRTGLFFFIAFHNSVYRKRDSVLLAICCLNICGIFYISTCTFVGAYVKPFILLLWAFKLFWKFWKKMLNLFL